MFSVNKICCVFVILKVHESDLALTPRLQTPDCLALVSEVLLQYQFVMEYSVFFPNCYDLLFQDLQISVMGITTSSIVSIKNILANFYNCLIIVSTVWLFHRFNFVMNVILV